MAYPAGAKERRQHEEGMERRAEGGLGVIPSQWPLRGDPSVAKWTRQESNPTGRCDPHIPRRNGEEGTTSLGYNNGQ